MKRHPINRNGHLKPPPSYVWAVQRHKQLEHEIARVQVQLTPAAVVERAARAPNMTAFDTWHEAAKRALTHLEREYRLWAAWLAERQPDAVLLREVWERVLVPLLEDGNDVLMPDEMKVVEKVRQHFSE